MYIYGHYKDNMELNIDGISILYIISIGLGYFKDKWDKYNWNKYKSKNVSYYEINKMFRIEET